MAIRRVKDIFLVLALLGLVAAIFRMGKGLGVSTALSDEIPWGLWKVLNMVAGVALATGGFVLAFLVHILHIKSLRPILRPALLVAFLGYGSSCMALLLDIGLPHRFWHPIFFWNEHSFLFEVFWCVLLYFSVTALEISPVALENSRFKKIYGFLKKIGKPVVILGITFSTMHHTSLGSLFLVSATRLHDIWWSPWLPPLFFLSAVGAGMMSIVLVTLVTTKLYRREAPMEALGKVAAGAAVVLTLYMLLKVADLIGRGALHLVYSGQWEGRLFLLEILLAAVIPVVLVAIPRVRRSAKGLALAALPAVLGLALNRVDVGIFGYFRSGGVTYVPTIAELAVTFGIPAAAGLFYFWFVERFWVFDYTEKPFRIEPAPVGEFDPMTRVWSGAFKSGLERTTLIAVIALPLGLMLFFSPAGAASDPGSPVSGPLGADAARHVLKLDGNRDGEFVLFDHEDHKQRLGGEDSCAECHHLDRPGDRWTSCHLCHSDAERSVSIFDHDRHVEMVAARDGHTGPLAGNQSCAVCHDRSRPSSRENAKTCRECHETDMRMSNGGDRRPDLAAAYKDALHGSCVGCHDAKAGETGRPLGECATCHER